MADKVRARLMNLRLAVFDLDGVLTDGKIWVTAEGHELRSMDVRDGYALARAAETGLPVWVISGANPPGVRQRLERLGVQEISLGIRDKAAEWKRLLEKHQIDPAEALYMGDDLPDLPVLRLAGLAACPQDAAPEVVAAAHYVVPRAGGSGCVRQLLEECLRLKGVWQNPSDLPAT